MNFSIKTIISLEGNIGVGKSSFMDILKEKLSHVAEFIYEPVEEWLEMKDENNSNLLDTFYKDKKRWAYTFQNVAYITRMNKIMDYLMSSNKKIIIMDRSLSGDLNTFTKMLREDGDMNEMEWQAYNKWNTFFNKYIGSNVEMKHIYLRSDPSVAFTRIQKRHRDEECSIPFDYIKKLHEYHDKWLLDNENSLLVQADKDFVNDLENKEITYNYVFNKMASKYL
jgi:deoxyadenosine/deoxycytidine kinase